MSLAYCESCGERGSLSFEDLMEGNASCRACGGVLVLMADEDEPEDEAAAEFAAASEAFDEDPSEEGEPLYETHPGEAGDSLGETHLPLNDTREELSGTDPGLPPLPSWDGSDTREVHNDAAYDELHAAAEALLNTAVSEPEVETVELAPGESSSGRASRSYDAGTLDETTRDWAGTSTPEAEEEVQETRTWKREEPEKPEVGEATRNWAVVPDPEDDEQPTVASRRPPPTGGLFSFDRDPDWEALLDEGLQEMEEADPSAKRTVIRVPSSAADQAKHAKGIDDLLRPYGITSPESGAIQRSSPTTQRWKVEPRTQTFHVFARVSSPDPQQRVPAVNFRDIDPAVSFARFPNSPAAGRFSTLASRFGPKSVLVTSAIRSEGRTSFALNLALAGAKTPGQEAILVEADLDGASAPSMLGVPNTDRGLLTLLEDQSDPRSALIRFDLGLFHILPRGRGGDRSKVPERLGDLLVEVRGHFPDALIVVDAGPVREGAARLLDKGVDGALLVVRKGRSTREEVADAVATVGRGRLLGAVFNEG